MFSLTREERKVILFLVIIALLGVGLNFFAKQNALVKSVICPSQELARIDLNTADKTLLISIPGIGEKLAQRIIDWRDSNSGFTQIEELKNIKGISNYKFEKIKDYLTTGQ